MRGHECIRQFRGRRESRKPSIERQPDSFAARMLEGQEAGLGGARSAPIGRDELHRALEVGEWNLRMLRCYLLIRPVADAVARQRVPIARPVAAEGAIAVIDQQRPLTGIDRIRAVTFRHFHRRLYWPLYNGPPG